MTSRNAGGSCSQSGWAAGQRPANRQPLGGLMGLGGSPLRRMRLAAFSRPPLTVGTADIKATL
jgi:hypothetical protein